jgi:hypothetical protein
MVSTLKALSPDSKAMELVEDTLPGDLSDFLDRPLFCFLASSTEEGPRISPLWFLWEASAVWILADTKTKTYPRRIERDSRAALAIVDFDPATGLVQHVGMRGQATLDPFDESRAKRLLRKYLGDDETEWNQERFGGPWNDRWQFIRFEPATVVARDHSY